MSIQREVRVPVAILLVIQLVTGFGSMALLSRMAPEIGRIVSDNGQSIRAVETMLSVLSERGPVSPVEEERFDEALEVARENMTEQAEQPILAEIAQHRSGALSGDAADRRAVASALVQLAEVNHESMLAADRRAMRLGESGAWAVALLTLLAALASIAVLRRLHARLVLPVHELVAASRAGAAGDVFRRARIVSLSDELVEIGAALNRHLDAAGRRVSSQARMDRVPDQTLSSGVDANALVDLIAGPALVFGHRGDLLHANDAARIWLKGSRGLAWRSAVMSYLREQQKSGHRTVRLPEHTSWASLGGEAFLVVVDEGQSARDVAADAPAHTAQDGEP